MQDGCPTVELEQKKHATNLSEVCKTRQKTHQKLVRIIVTDPDATDSDSSLSEDQGKPVSSRGGEKQITRISIDIPSDSASSFLSIPFSSKEDLTHFKKRKKLIKDNASSGGQKKFIGVRRRKWGRWAAEIRDSTSRKRLWLGTFDTAEEAAVEYDKAAVRLKGPGAITNFPPSAMEDMPAIRNSPSTESFASISALASPTSVLS